MADIETPDDVTKLVERAKWAANAVYLAAEEGPATDISRIIRGLLAALAAERARADQAERLQVTAERNFDTKLVEWAEAKARADRLQADVDQYVTWRAETAQALGDAIASADREATARHEAEQEVSSVEAVLSETSAEANRRFDRYEADLAALRATKDAGARICPVCGDESGVTDAQP